MKKIKWKPLYTIGNFQKKKVRLKQTCCKVARHYQTSWDIWLPEVLFLIKQSDEIVMFCKNATTQIQVEC